jgi:hypothetical protein
VTIGIIYNSAARPDICEWKLDLQLPMQSVPITTKVVSSNSWQGVLAAGGWFSLDTTVSSTNKTDRHDIAEVELKVALNTMTL